jgi:F0F1-type ATP synthase membrane subunit b/b'
MSLIENVLSLETQANQVVESAKAEAQRMEASAEEQAAAARAEVAASVERRTAAFRADAEAKVAQELKKADEEHSAARARLDQIPAERIAGQVKAVTARLVAGEKTGA